MTKANGVTRIGEITKTDPPPLLILFDRSQDDIVKIVADVLGQAYYFINSLDDVAGRSDGVVVGLQNDLIPDPETIHDIARISITTHAVDIQDSRDEYFTSYCNYEYLYHRNNFSRRDLTRFLGFTLGQVQPHDHLTKKMRTTLLSTTFPDIRGALPNLDILSVGADSIELRVDLLKEPSVNGRKAVVPSLKYVGEQVMALRQRTELPIIFTTRCTNENGRFPMDDPLLFYRYLRKAIQWGCEYVDVELWLPEEIRRKLSAEKGNSKIISAWHDFSGRFSWSSSEAHRLFREGAIYGDVVKMIAMINDMGKNYELEQFRSFIQSKYPHPPFSGLNMGPIGQLSRTLNKVFTPVTHPLLPMIAAPGQISVAEINSRLHSMGNLRKLDLYAIGNVSANGQAMFLEKCLNELSLPHRLCCMESLPPESIVRLIDQQDFGGVYINPPLSAATPHLPRTTDAAATIGHVDTVLMQAQSHGKSLVCDNATWKGIRATLTRDFVPSAYTHRPALVLANAEAPAAAAIYALLSLDVGPIYTIGFKSKGAPSTNVQQFCSVEDMKTVEDPFVIISALPSAKSLVVSPLLKHYSGSSRRSQYSGKVFLDLSNGIRGKGDSVDIAATLGYQSYGSATVNASTMVETLRMLLGFNVGFGFVTLASGRSLFT